MKNRFFLLIGVCLFLPIISAQAEVADRDQPMHIEADAMRYDDIGKITTASGRVIASQGSLLLRADAVEVRQGDQGKNLIIATSNAGNQVFMRQKREGLNEFFEAQANRVERDEKTYITRLVGNAVLRHLIGTKLVDEIKGETVIYNEVTEVYNVASGASGKTPPSGIPSGRVRAIITPRSTIAAPATSSSPTVTSSSRKTVSLQPSSQIGAGND